MSEEEMKVLLDLIEKQSKEIEELKQDRDEYKEEYIKLQNARYYNYISKAKIKSKIEELDEKLFEKNKILDNLEIYYKKEVLKSLLKGEE